MGKASFASKVAEGLSMGCQWRYLPKDLRNPPAILLGLAGSPKSTLYDYFDLWTYGGTPENIHHALWVKFREQIGLLLIGGI